MGSLFSNASQVQSALLTGARGFTGRYMEAALRSRGYNVIGVDRAGPYSCDLTDARSVKELVSTVKPDVVLHLAAVSFVGHEDPGEFYRANVFGTLNLIEALTKLDKPPSRVLVTSSANVYGNPAVDVIDESVCPAPVSHYACSKLAMECMVKTYFDRLPIIITRPFNYTGPGQSEKFVIPKIVRHFRDGSPIIELGNLEVTRDLSDVNDVVRAYLELLETDIRSEIINICSEHLVGLIDVLGMMNKLSGYEIKVRVNPALVRATEIRQLRGTSAKLRSLVKLPAPLPFSETLRRMYES